MRTALYNDLLWHLHDLWPEQTFPGCALLSKTWTGTIGRRLVRAEQTARVRSARDELRHLRELSLTTDALEAEIAELVGQAATQLLAEPGFGPLTARWMAVLIWRACRRRLTDGGCCCPS